MPDSEQMPDMEPNMHVRNSVETEDNLYHNTRICVIFRRFLTKSELLTSIRYLPRSIRVLHFVPMIQKGS